MQQISYMSTVDIHAHRVHISPLYLFETAEFTRVYVEKRKGKRNSLIRVLLVQHVCVCGGALQCITREERIQRRLFPFLANSRFIIHNVRARARASLQGESEINNIRFLRRYGSRRLIQILPVDN